MQCSVYLKPAFRLQHLSYEKSKSKKVPEQSSWTTVGDKTESPDFYNAVVKRAIFINECQ